MNIYYTPFTYLLGWSKQNTWYYGMRIAKKNFCLYECGCHPDDLWQTYFSSSKRVRDFVEKFGTPDIIQIRKTFVNEPDKARDWESRVLRRMKVIFDSRFLNQSDNRCFKTLTEEEEAQRVSKIKATKDQKGWAKPFLGKSHSTQTKSKMSLSKELFWSEVSHEQRIDLGRKMSKGKKIASEHKKPKYKTPFGEFVSVPEAAKAEGVAPQSVYEKINRLSNKDYVKLS